MIQFHIFNFWVEKLDGNLSARFSRSKACVEILSDLIEVLTRAYPACSNPLPPKLRHDPRHFQRRLRGFAAAIVFLAEAADAGVFHLVEDEHAVDNGNSLLHLNRRQRVRDAPADVLRVACLALENDAEADDG